MWVKQRKDSWPLRMSRSRKSPRAKFSTCTNVRFNKHCSRLHGPLLVLNFTQFFCFLVMGSLIDKHLDLDPNPDIRWFSPFTSRYYWNLKWMAVKIYLHLLNKFFFIYSMKIFWKLTFFFYLLLTVVSHYPCCVNPI